MAYSCTGSRADTPGPRPGCPTLLTRQLGRVAGKFSISRAFVHLTLAMTQLSSHAGKPTAQEAAQCFWLLRPLLQISPLLPGTRVIAIYPHDMGVRAMSTSFCKLS